MGKPRKGQLPEKMRRFALEYLRDLNATQAAIRAGYKEKTAKAQGSRLLTNVDVQKLIEEGRKEVESQIKFDAARVLQELARIGLCDIGQAFDEHGNLRPIREIPEDVRRAISGVEVDELWENGEDGRHQTGITRKVKFWDKPKSLELLGKHLKLFVEKIDLNAKVTQDFGSMFSEFLKD